MLAAENTTTALYIGIGVLVVITIIIITIVATKARKLATPSTVKKVQRDRIAILNGLIEPIAGGKKSIFDIEKTVPNNQQLLINYCMNSCRLAGYLGPLQDGVFAEEDAVRLGFAAGCRLFVVEISEGEDGRPALIARDSMGYKRSLNNGSVSKLFSALASSSGRGDQPLLLALYFHDAPRDMDKYLGFLSQVAVALEPLIPYHLGLTDVGDFTRQKKANELFTYPPDFYKGKVLIMTNADTSAFRNPQGVGVNRTFSPREDLDFFIHSRIFSLTSGLGISSSGGVGTSSATVVIADDSYFLTTPPDKVASVVNMTRNTFTIVIHKDPSWVPAGSVADTLQKTYGVQSIPVPLDTATLLVDDAWTVKEPSTRFTKPAPIVPTVPNPKLDARGGSLVAPQL
jgi:hypothetical protein